MPAMPFARFSAEVLELYESESARATFRKMRQCLKEFGRVRGLERTSDMTDLAIVRWKALHPGRGCWTVRSLLISWRAACNIAIKKGYLKHSPFNIKSLSQWAPTEEPDCVKHHALEAIGRVLRRLEESASAGWEAHRLFALASTVAWTGVRAGEAAHAKVEDFDLVEGVLVISPRRRLKTRRSAQPVPIPPGLMPTLRAWLPAAGSEWAFPGVRRRSPWTGGLPGRKPLDRLKAAAREVDVEGFTFQSLRHSWATHAEGPWGLSDPQIQRNLRHTTIRTSRQSYRHADLPNLRAIGERVTFPRVAAMG